jgi:hypothetical protein
MSATTTRPINQARRWAATILDMVEHPGDVVRQPACLAILIGASTGAIPCGRDGLAWPMSDGSMLVTNTGGVIVA